MCKCQYSIEEGFCNAPFKCNFAEGVFKQCTAKEDDLVAVCEICECNQADAEFPFEEMCKECAKSQRD